MRDDLASRVAVLEQQAIVVQHTADKVVAKVELAAEKSYLESQINGLREAFNQQINYQKDATLATLAASDKAILKSETATEKRFESVNEFRAALSDQAGNKLSRAEFNVQHDNLMQRLAAQTKRIEDLQLQLTGYMASASGKQIGVGVIGSIVMGIIAATTAVAAVVTFLTLHH